MQTSQALTLRGVRVHNLKNIDVEIPLNRLTVVTGVSGAGKSSLVFDTLYAEAQRRYLQSFSVYTRQFLERFDKPDAEFISDLPPAVTIRRAPGSTARVTVGALSELDASVRLLFARAGTIVCPGCANIVKSHASADVLAALEKMPPGTRSAIAFPVTATEDDSWHTGLREEGYVRIQVDGEMHRLDEKDLPPITEGQLVWVLLDRVETGKTTPERMLESIDAAFRRGDGRLGILRDTEEVAFDQRPYCPSCDREFPPLEPRLFDVDDPLGGCPDCKGSGTRGKSNETCPRCAGRRWNENALAVKIAGDSIAGWNARSLTELLDIIQRLSLPGELNAVVEPLRQRLQGLVQLKLGYLTLQQNSHAISDGAALRIRLASALASNLVNVLYLIDEPTLGIHTSEMDAVAGALTQLRDRGSTVVVIDNERCIIEAADQVIDLGPGAGEDGGNITYLGPPQGLTGATEHPTSDFWTGRSFVEVPQKRRKPTGWLKLAGFEFPRGVLCVVCGVGESGHVGQAFQPDGAKPNRGRKKSGASEASSGAVRLESLTYVLLDQTALARGARSNPATYLKIFDEIRDLFAQTVDAKIRNYGPGHFSFNQPGGRCEACEGQGTQTIDMQFLADVQTTCPECHGRRYRKEILAIKVRSLSIAEVLDLTVREAFRFFRAQPAIEKKLKVLLDVGLDYLRLGQSMETLSGSECQRLKLASHLATSRKTGCLFLIVEPTAGLHAADVVELLDCFERLLASGHSLIVVDNDMYVIKSADWLIELGFDGGKRITATGTPEQMAVSVSPTGRLLAVALNE